jgi:hypothetical protein
MPDAAGLATGMLVRMSTQRATSHGSHLDAQQRVDDELHERTLTAAPDVVHGRSHGGKHRLGRLEGDRVAADHEDQLCEFRLGKRAGNRSIEQPPLEANHLRRQLPDPPGRNGTGLDDDATGSQAAKGSVIRVQPDLGRSLIITHHRHREVGVLHGMPRRLGRDRAQVDQGSQR